METFEDHNAGKTNKEVEYGVQYPNGDVIWQPRGYLGADIETKKGRAQLRKDFAESLKNLHTPQVGELSFLKRKKTTKYSQPETIDV